MHLKARNRPPRTRWSSRRKTGGHPGSELSSFCMMTKNLSVKLLLSQFPSFLGFTAVRCLRTGSLSFGIVDTLEWIILCCGACLVQCTVFSSTPGLYPLGPLALPLQPWISYLHFLRLSFPICKIRMIIILTGLLWRLKLPYEAQLAGCLHVASPRYILAIFHWFLCSLHYRRGVQCLLNIFLSQFVKLETPFRYCWNWNINPMRTVWFFY